MKTKIILIVSALVTLAVSTQSFAQTFQAIPGFGNSLSVAVGDMNGDGKQDVVGTRYPSTEVVVALGDGVGGFGTPAAFSAGGADIALGDINGDGKLDVVVGGGTGTTISVLLGDGAGNLGAPTTYNLGEDGISGVALGDFNGDGKLDVAVLTNTNLGQVGSVWVLLNDGTGQLIVPALPARQFNVGYGSTGAKELAAADLDNDGNLDLVVVSQINQFQDGPPVNILYGNGNGTFAATVSMKFEKNASGQQMSNETQGVAIADLNEDGRPDLVVSSYVYRLGGGSVTVFLNTGSRTFAAPVSSQSLRQSVNPSVGDLNGDGHLDVAVASAPDGGIAYFLGNGMGGLAAAPWVFMSGAPWGLALGDLNGSGNGTLDFVVGTLGDGTKVAFNGTPLSLFFSDYLAGPSSPNLAIPTAKYDYSAQGLVRTQSNNDTDRPMVKTVLGSYLSTDFVYEVDVLRTTTSDMDISFVGFGQGTPNGAFFNEPANAFVFRIHNSPGFYRIDAAVEAASGAGAPLPALSEGIANFGNGVGTRFRITRIGDTVTLSVPSQNASRSFSISQYAAQLGLNGSNAYLFFGNTLTGTVFSNVTVTLPVSDTTPPVIGAVSNLTAEATSAAGAAVTFALPTATDAVDAAPTVSASPASGSTFALGVTTVTVTATDTAGNSSTKTFTVTVQDTTAPTASLSLSAGSLWPPNHKLVAITPTLTASDLAGPVTISGPTITSNEPINGLGDGDTSPDWIITGTNGVQLRAERSGTGNGRTYTITYVVTDRAGNATTVSATVFVPKSQGK